MNRYKPKLPIKRNFRLSKEANEQLIRAVIKFNSSDIPAISMSDFIRLAVKTFANQILIAKEKVSLIIK